MINIAEVWIANVTGILSMVFFLLTRKWNKDNNSFWERVFNRENVKMRVLDIISWLPKEQISLVQLEQIFNSYMKGIPDKKYSASITTPQNITGNVLSCIKELQDEKKQMGYILLNGKVVAVIGYRQ